MFRLFHFAVLCLAVLSSPSAFGRCEVSKSKDQYGNAVTEYRSSGSTQTAALLLPPTGGENVADRNLAKALCSRGLTTVIFNYFQPDAQPGDLSSHDRFSQQTLRWINDFLKLRHEQEWGVIGSSLGSLYASMAFGLGHLNPTGASFPALSKLRAAVLVAAGGSLAEILATSQLPSIVSQREIEENLFSVSSASDYQERLQQAIQYDPLKFAMPDLNKNILMFSSSTDSIVPAKTQQELWLAWGKPERQIFSTDHTATIARVYFLHVNKIFDFLQKQLYFFEAESQSPTSAAR